MRIRRYRCSPVLAGVMGEISIHESRKNTKYIILGILEIVAIFLSVLSLGSSFFHDNLLFELTSHFKVQYLAVSILLLLYFSIRKKKKAIVWFAILSIYNSSFVLPWYLSAKDIKSGKASATLKLLHSNVYTANQNKLKLIELIYSEKPDIIIAQEIDNKWAEALTEIEGLYPYNIVLPRTDNFGMALYSKLPLGKAKELTENIFGIPTVSAVIQLNGKEIELISMHTLPPISNEYFKSRNSQLNYITTYSKESRVPLILVGDLNVSMWSQHYLSLEKEAQLSNSRRGFGILPSWSSNIPFTQIPIDHCLISQGIKVLETKLGKDIHSDHLPLIVILAI